MVLLFRYVWRVVLEVAAPCISYVQVNRVSVSVHFPYSRYGDSVPVRVIESGRPESGRSLPTVPYPFEFPLSVEGQVILRILPDRLTCLFPVRVCEERGVHWRTVDCVDFRITPFIETLGSSWKSRQCCQRRYGGGQQCLSCDCCH